jgi:hypothetical protein
MTYVNCIRQQCTHYCGRASSRHKAKGDPIDLSILGNPNPLRFEEDRDDNIREYTVYLVDRLRKCPPLVEILRLIPDDAVLGCFCYPKNCHCRPIIDACEYLKKNDL